MAIRPLPAVVLSSFAIGITNFAAILTFLFALSWFGIAGPLSIGKEIALTAGAFFGTFLRRPAFCGCAAALKHRTGQQNPGPHEQNVRRHSLWIRPCGVGANLTLKNRKESNL